MNGGDSLPKSMRLASPCAGIGILSEGKESLVAEGWTGFAGKAEGGDWLSVQAPPESTFSRQVPPSRIVRPLGNRDSSTKLSARVFPKPPVAAGRLRVFDHLSSNHQQSIESQHRSPSR